MKSPDAKEGFVMKTDAYTKVVLTGIAIFLGVIAFDYKPSMKAEASTSVGGEMIASSDIHKFWHLKDGRVRECWHNRSHEAECSPWLKWVTKE